MGNVAILMKKLGHDVLGSDKGMYDPMKSALAAAGVRSYEGWSARNLEEFFRFFAGGLWNWPEGVWYTGGTEVFGGICRTRWFPCMFSSIKNSRSKYQPQILEFLSNSQHASLILLSPSVNFL